MPQLGITTVLALTATATAATAESITQHLGMPPADGDAIVRLNTPPPYLISDEPVRLCC